MRSLKVERFINAILIERVMEEGLDQNRVNNERLRLWVFV